MSFTRFPDYTSRKACDSTGDPNTTKPTMEDGYVLPGGNNDEQPELPPGFRFHPTDEELVIHYLSRKAADHGFSGAGVIGEVDLNKCEPWDLPWRGAKMGETKEWYFFCVRDRKYPAGLRTNRATDAGYWKATGKDKEVRRGKSLVGRKKTLVFYGGRAPKGEKTGWVMHEYRLDGSSSLYNKIAKNEWVICRVFQKGYPSAAATEEGGGGKKVVDLQARTGSSGCYGDGVTVGGSTSSDPLPPLMDFPFGDTGCRAVGATPLAPGAAHVTCFSNAAASHKNHEELVDSHSFPPLFSASAYNNPCSGVSSSMLPLAKLSGEAGQMQLLQSHGHGVVEGIGKMTREEAGRSVWQETGFSSDMNPGSSSSQLLLPGHCEESRQKAPPACPIWQYAPW